jgi:hypothetical integral membrane protein (TIGR02206 family)
VPFPLYILAAAANDVRPGEGFDNFSLLHLVTVAACIAVMVVLAVLAARWRGTPAGEGLRKAWFAIVLVVQVANIIYYAFFVEHEAGQPFQVDWSKALPLQICDLAGITAVAALVWKPRLLRTLLYFWAIGLSTQAFITPTLGYGPIYFHFWVFWLSHTTLTATAIYFLAAERYRPTWRDFGIITIAMMVYGAVVIPLDIATGFDYGFAGQSFNLGTPTVLDFLGPWPLRLLYLFLIIEAVFAVMTVVWWRPSRSKPQTR